MDGSSLPCFQFASIVLVYLIIISTFQFIVPTCYPGLKGRSLTQSYQQPLNSLLKISVSKIPDKYTVKIYNQSNKVCNYFIFARPPLILNYYIDRNRMSTHRPGRFTPLMTATRSQSQVSISHSVVAWTSLYLQALILLYSIGRRLIYQTKPNPDPRLRC